MASLQTLLSSLFSCLIFSGIVHGLVTPLKGEDLLLDSLMPINSALHKDRVQRDLDSEEGSGDVAIPIVSLPRNMLMQRLTQEPSNSEFKKAADDPINKDTGEINVNREEMQNPDDGATQEEMLHDIDEGSGASEKEDDEGIPKPVVSDVIDNFKEEEGMEKVLIDLTGTGDKSLVTDDDNKHDNALSVQVPSEAHDSHQLASNEQRLEDSEPLVLHGNNQESDGSKNEEKNTGEGVAEDTLNVSDTTGHDEINVIVDHLDLSNNGADGDSDQQTGEKIQSGSEVEEIESAEIDVGVKNIHSAVDQTENGGILQESGEETSNSAEKLKESTETVYNEKEGLLLPVDNEKQVINENLAENLTEKTPTEGLPIVNEEGTNENEPTDTADGEEDESDDETESIEKHATLLSGNASNEKEVERAGKMIVLVNDTESEEQSKADEATPTPVAPDVEEGRSIVQIRLNDTASQDDIDTTLVPAPIENSSSPGIVEEDANVELSTTTQPDEATTSESASEGDIISVETTTERKLEVEEIVIPPLGEVSSTTEEALPTETSSTTETIILESSSPAEMDAEEELSPETVTEAQEISTEETTTLEVILQGAMIEGSKLGQREKITNSEDGMQNAGSTEEKNLGAYILIGLIAVCFLALLAFLVLRKRSKAHKARLDNNHERDPEKALLSNGKYKEDSDESNLKNNEITPLVIKQNSQINKFEKSPNFSSPKNLNTAVNDKNIEKDNVLKSTQAIIEEEEDAKKALEEDKKPDDEIDEEKKALMSENAPTEKVIVRTHVDQDSIPKKPVLVTRNGNGYHAVSQDPV